MSPPRALVIVPSRERDERLDFMLGEALALSAGTADFAVCYDEDDPRREAYAKLRRKFPQAAPGVQGVLWFHGPRRSMTGWTNWMAAHPRAARYELLGSLGDDHVPVTPGWDRELADAITALGGTGISYGDDRHQHEALPTAPFISRDIADALGWMCLPGTLSKYCDDAWKALGEMAGCLSYVPGVIIEHLHPDAGKAPQDATYQHGNESWAADRQAFSAWRAAGCDRDAAIVRGLMYHASGTPR
jgi:hypothetical protein